MFTNVFHSPSTPTPPVSRPLTPIDGNGKLTPLAKIETDQKIIKNCPFEKHGCKFVGSRLAIQEHMRDQNDVHITLIGEQLRPFQDEILQGLKAVNSIHKKAAKTETVAKHLLRSYSSTFIWHIENYPKKYAAAKKGTKIFVNSPAFLTSRFGYSITVSIAPLGDLESSRIFSSIYVSINPGLHDGILEWPFKATVIFKIVDQKDGTDPFIAKLVPEITEENMASLTEPNGKPNMKFGLQKFIKITEMEEGGKYVKKGHVYIAIDFENLPEI